MKQKTINHFWALQHKETGLFLNELISDPHTKRISTCLRWGSRAAARDFKKEWKISELYKIVKINCVIE